MYETVRMVNGYRIYRMKGTHGCYHVDLQQNTCGSKISKTFGTIKAAVSYIESLAA